MASSDKRAPNSLDGPPPAVLKKAKVSLSDIAAGRGLPGGDEFGGVDEFAGPLPPSSSPIATTLIGMQQAEQGIQLIIGANPDLAPILQQGLLQLKQLITQTVAGQSTGPMAGPMSPMGGVGMGGMAPGMAPATSLPGGLAAPGPGIPPGMPIPPGA